MIYVTAFVAIFALGTAITAAMFAFGEGYRWRWMPLWLPADGAALVTAGVRLVKG